jgi:hypothetical protein
MVLTGEKGWLLTVMATMEWGTGVGYGIKYYGVGTYEAGFRLGTGSRSLDIYSIYDDNADGINFYTGTGASNDIKVKFANNGNVGIGTTSPSTVLDVVGEGTAIGSTGYYYNARFKDTANVGVLIGHNNTSNGNGMIAGVNKLAFLTYGTDWGERMVIDGDGNVGIGTTSPVTGLDVRTSAYSNTTARFGETRPVYIVNNDPIIGFNQYFNGGWKAGTTGSSGNIGMNNGGEMYFNVSTASVATDGAVTNRQAIKIFNDANITWGTGGTAAWGEGLLTMNSGWGTNLYPTLGSYDGSTGSLIMLHNPHIPFRTDNAVSASYTGRAGLRMAIAC